MKYFLLAISISIFSFQVMAEKIQSQIHSLDIGTNGQPHLVKLMNGQVAFIPFIDKTLLEQIEESLNRKDWIELTLDNTYLLQSFQIISSRPTYELPNRPTSMDQNEPYVPSVVTSTKAKSIFQNMRKDYKNKSQCFNRAHVWTYEEFIRAQTNSNKVFIFFTSRYIRNYRFNWWFHVTPMLFVGGTKESNWMMLDRRYTSGPLREKAWTDIFIRSKRYCKTVYKYSDYRENQQSQDCYLIQASMYFNVPSDLERLERTGEVRTSYETLEVDYAYWEAFNIERPTPVI